MPRFRDRLEAGPTPEDGVCTFRCQDLHRILEEEFGVSLRRQAIYDLLHRLDSSSLMPRPQHEQANPEVQEFFKEIVVERIDAIAAAHPEEQIHTYFQDEARFGQLSFTHISLLTEVLTAINLAAIFHNTVHLFELSIEPNENTINI